MNIEMAQLGLSNEVIIAKIRQAYEAGTDAVSASARIKLNPVVILTGVAASHREAAAESKDPYF